MKKTLLVIIFITGFVALAISAGQLWRIAVFVDQHGFSARQLLGGNTGLVLSWLQLLLLAVVCVAAAGLLHDPRGRAGEGTLARDTVLETPRLTIRRFRKEDWRDLYEYLSDPEVVRYEPYGVYDQSMSKLEAQSRAEDDDFLAVCLRDGGKMIGNLYFAGRDFGTREIGYVFNPRYQKQGYATEAVEKLMDTAFRQWRVRKIIAMCDPRNDNSWHLLERVGFQREAHFREKASFKTDSTGKPIWHDAYEYGLLATEWQKDR